MNMPDINWNQIFNNLNPKPEVSRQNLNPAPQLNMPQINNQQQINSQMQILFPGASAQLAQTASELAEMNQKQAVDMLKDMLNVPRNMEQLISQLTTNSSYVNIKTAMFLLNSTLDIMKLSAMLQNTSKDAITNLAQIISKYSQTGLPLKEEQITQIAKMLTIVSTSTTSEVQTLKTMMLLYLPWLPLTSPDMFKLEIAKAGSSGGLEGTDSITVMIATENYGNVMGVLSKTDEESISADITVSKSFPCNDLKYLLNEESKKYSVNINCSFTQKSEFDKDKVKKSKTKVVMNTSPGVNPFLILIAGAFIKHVHDTDKINNLKSDGTENYG